MKGLYKPIMVQLIQIFTANASALLLLIMLKAHMGNKFCSGRLLDVRILNAMINLTMFQCIFDSLVFWIDGKSFTGAILLNTAGNIVYYIINCIIAYLWPLFTDYKMNKDYARTKKLASHLSVPLIVCSLLILSSPFTGIIFTVNEKNMYTRTDLFFLIPSLLIVFYVVFGTLQVYFNKNRNGYMFFPAIYFIAPITIAMAIQSCHYGISLLFVGISIGLTGVYLSTQNNSAYVDSLCGVYNRRYCNEYIEAFINSGKKDDTITGVLIDMDNFKGINDNLGHSTGDAALTLFSSVLRKNIDKIGFAARFGGDEFILITKESPKTAENIINEINRELENINSSGSYEFRLAFSYGIAEITPSNSSDELINKMDSQMYEMKKSRKVSR